MIGISNLPLRTGGYMIPVETIDSTNKILEVNVPAGSRIMCTNCTLENQSVLESDGSILSTTNGFFINKNINGLKILRPANETPSLTILRGREILYCDNGVKKITLKIPSDGATVAIEYRGEMHALMGGYYRNAHYKWNGVSWVSASILPYECNRSFVVVYNDELHLLGGAATGTGQFHYKWDGNEWTKVSTLPLSFHNGGAVVCNNEIHIITDEDTTSTSVHYKWDGNEWTKVSTLPYVTFNAIPMVFNNEINIFGGYGFTAATYHYKWNGTEWVSVSSLPEGASIPLNYDNKIYIMSSTNLFRLDGTTWVNVSTLPYTLKSTLSCVYDNTINIMGGASGTDHYIWDGVSWKNYSLKNAFNLPMGSRVNGIMCEVTGENIIPEKNNYLIEL